MSTLAVDAITTAAGTSAMTINAAGKVNFPNGLSGTQTGDQKYPFVAWVTSTYSINNSTSTLLSCQGTSINTSSVYDTTNYRFVAPVNGYYWFAANARTNNQTNNARVDMLFRKNAAGVMGSGQNQTNSNDMGIMGQAIIYCAQNDYVDVMLYINGSSNVNVLTTNNNGNFGGTQYTSWMAGFMIQAA